MPLDEIEHRNGGDDETRVVLVALRFWSEPEPSRSEIVNLVVVSWNRQEGGVSSTSSVPVEWETADHLIEQLKSRCVELQGEILELRARMDSPLYTRQEAAEFLRVCSGTIDREIASGRLPRVVIRGAVRVPKDSVRALIGLY